MEKHALFCRLVPAVLQFHVPTELKNNSEHCVGRIWHLFLYVAYQAGTKPQN